MHSYSDKIQQGNYFLLNCMLGFIENMLDFIEGLSNSFVIKIFESSIRKTRVYVEEKLKDDVLDILEDAMHHNNDADLDVFNSNEIFTRNFLFNLGAKDCDNSCNGEMLSSVYTNDSILDHCICQ